MSVLDSLNAYTALRAVVSGLVLEEVERDGYLNKLDALVPRMVDALEAEIRWVIERTHAKPAATPTAAAPEPLKADYTYDDFAELAEANGRNPADFVRVWFKDLDGGYELSTAAQRVDVYAQARAWCAEQKAKESTPRPRVLNGGGQRPQGRPQGRQGGGQNRGNWRPNPIGPCPVCGPQETKMISTRNGDRWRCDEHDYWGDVG